MHNHHIRNPLSRQFTPEEESKIEEEKKLELHHELIEERLSVYQVMKTESSAQKAQSMLSPRRVEEVKKKTAVAVRYRHFRNLG